MERVIRSVWDPESVRERQARAQEADRISHDPINDPEGLALVQAIHDRKRKAAMTTETPTIQAWTTDNEDAVVWGTHDLAVAKEVYDVTGFDTMPDWDDVRLMWGAPHLPDWEVWSPDNYGNEPQEGWVPYMVFGF